MRMTTLRRKNKGHDGKATTSPNLCAPGVLCMLPSAPHRYLIAIGLAALLAGPGCIDLIGAAEGGKYVERETRHFPTSATPDLNFETFDGSIEVRAWDKAEVEVTIERRAVSKEAADSIEVQAGQSGNAVTVAARVRKVPGFGLHFNARSAKLIVLAPLTSNLTARSGDGAITVERISGRADLRTGDGGIRGRDLGGDIKARSGDGSIRLDGVHGSLDVDTGDGSVAVSGVLTAVRARTGDGAVTIRAETGSAPAADWDIATGDGAITLRLPGGFNAELDAHTNDGGIHMRDLTLTNVSGELRRNSVRGQLGSGGRLVKLRTGDGSITLSRSVPAERETY
jgi:hypothetical protein